MGIEAEDAFLKKHQIVTGFDPLASSLRNESFRYARLALNIEKDSVYCAESFNEPGGSEQQAQRLCGDNLICWLCASIGVSSQVGIGGSGLTVNVDWPSEE